jgi:hypothetical protein
MPLPYTYSFLDFQATLSGPGGAISFGSGAAAAKEGISFEFTEDKDRLTVGADGSPMHSLVASLAGKVLVRLLKTSLVNYQLSQMYNVQKASSLFWGQNVITGTNPVSGDVYTCTQVAFAKFPRNDFAEEAGMLEYDFNCGSMQVELGAGVLL